ncbi:cell division protein FtsN [Dysgonomonas sp. PH5-45]|uniref:SPOR domain-containing protein n=1 Tax=unclassified Dysgonomonas TaxID=2630389 RepID=UPI0024736D58|nr:MULTISPECIES: SPOR domain-containing protein [unclassified Dysgonomonas]MDH6354375.1 cell division protein FtsN [Dysgonomonas sp. PH5-45]MDH6387275.1 cell division protein FtsN [Dysgonomonas sp. PH5-37]
MNKLFGIGLALSLIIGFSSCKSKQSAYKSVYEAAREREIEENKKETETVSKPAYPAYTANVSDEPVRTEKIKPVYDTDASGLKSYSVVIATLSVKPNAEILKERMEREGHSIILAQNEQGMYRVIIASYDDKAQAVNKRNELTETYNAKGDTDFLRRTYNIPFNDLWILQRQY